MIVIRGRWCKMSTLMYHSLACRTGKKHGKKQGKLIAHKLI
jgi:hypothetical protein